MIARGTKPTLVSVISGGRYLGCLLSRGPMGYEAWDAADRSIGMFADAKAAAEAVNRSSSAS